MANFVDVDHRLNPFDFFQGDTFRFIRRSLGDLVKSETVTIRFGEIVEAAEVRIPSKSLTRCLPWDPCSPAPNRFSSVILWQNPCLEKPKGSCCIPEMMQRHEFKQLPRCNPFDRYKSLGSGRALPE